MIQSLQKAVRTFKSSTQRTPVKQSLCKKVKRAAVDGHCATTKLGSTSDMGRKDYPPSQKEQEKLRGPGGEVG